MSYAPIIIFLDCFLGKITAVIKIRMSFLEERPVGGIPLFTWIIHKQLPRSKKKREFINKIQMFVFTYVVYALFNMARRPLPVVKLKFIEECNGTVFAAQQYNSYSPLNLSSIRSQPSNETWCDEMVSFSNSEEFFGFMEFLLMAAYGLCLYVSGVVADCYNPRYYLTGGCFLSGYFCALLGLIDYWNIRSAQFLESILILSGAFQSTAWPVLLSTVTHWYGVVGHKRGLFFGLWNTHNYIGSILGIYLAIIWVDHDWQWSFFVPGFILALTGVLVFIYLIADPNDLKELDKEIGSKESLTRQRSRSDVPTWLSGDTSITMYEALMLPGVIEFSACMFFSRLVGYIWLFWLPVFMQKAKSLPASAASLYLLEYAMGASCGGILAGILVDLFQRSATVCVFFLLCSIIVLILRFILILGYDNIVDSVLTVFLGLFVEAPYIVISTSVSADLGTHKLIKKNHRALSTIGGIIEGTGAIGASIGSYICGLMLVKAAFNHIVYVMIACQLLALLCLVRQVYKEFQRRERRSSVTEYLKLPKLT